MLAPPASAVRVLDGGLSTELRRAGLELDPRLWTAGALLDAPEALVDVARRFVKAGASMVSTATYQVSLTGLAQRGVAESAALQLVSDAGRRLRDAMPEAIEVAGSLGPYGAHLADGSEYRGDYAVSPDRLREHFTPLIDALAPEVDWLAFETFPQARELLALLELLADWPTPLPRIWISLSTRNAAHLADGTPIAELAPRLHAHPKVTAIGVNCCPPQRILPLLNALRAHGDKPLIAYPNLGDTGPAALHSHDTSTPLAFMAPEVQSWIEAGARIIGGCCGCGARELAALHALTVGGPRALPQD